MGTMFVDGAASSAVALTAWHYSGWSAVAVIVAIASIVAVLLQHFRSGRGD